MVIWTFALHLLILALAGAGLMMVLWTFHKTRQIHVATFRLLEDSSAIHKESAALFSQLQALFSLESKLGLPESLPPVRGWAGSPDFLLTVADAVLNRKPKTVVECSSGVSTLVIARCLQLNGSGHVYSLEHDQNYADKSKRMLKQYGVDDWATVLYAPLVECKGNAVWYDDAVLPTNLAPIELLVIDGPPHDSAPLARLPALPRLLPRMAHNAAVILDDAAREAELEIVKRWLELAPDFKETYLHHEKGCAVLAR